MKPEYRCKYCGAPSWIHPLDQEPPPDYCHESDHGEPPEPEPAVEPKKYHNAALMVHSLKAALTELSKHARTAEALARLALQARGQAVVIEYA